MYKRRARVVFLASTNTLAERVVRCAEAVGSRWIQAAAYPSQLNDYDLLVTLDAESLCALPLLPLGGRHKHWPLSALSSDADIEAHVESLVGGMRLLAMLDQSSAPAH
ncbi:MAG TPA: hypothetical protein VMV40_03680 [Acidiferrobacter sp.]|nr:hypothetical protein [Acidiferrobacter sp.]